MPNAISSCIAIPESAQIPANDRQGLAQVTGLPDVLLDVVDEFLDVRQAPDEMLLERPHTEHGLHTYHPLAKRYEIAAMLNMPQMGRPEILVKAAHSYTAHVVRGDGNCIVLSVRLEGQPHVQHALNESATQGERWVSVDLVDKRFFFHVPTKQDAYRDFIAERDHVMRRDPSCCTVS